MHGIASTGREPHILLMYMKCSTKETAVLVVLALAAASAFAAVTDTHTVSLTLNAIATVKIAPAGAITLVITEPVTAGGAPLDVTNATKYLQYTVVSSTAYRIAVSAAGAVPGGTLLKVTAAAPVGATGTSVGTSAGAVTLTNGMAATALLTTIQNVFTGVAATSGANLTYTFGVGGTFGDEVPGTSSLTVTYTLTTP